MDSDTGSEGGSDDSLHCTFGLDKKFPTIPHRERQPLPPDTSIQGRYSKWKEKRTPSLDGKSLEQVKIEASKIKLRASFSSFAEFDRCLDSWSVLQGRSSSKYETKHTHAVRVCRFGKTVRVHETTKIIADKLTSPQSSMRQFDMASTPSTSATPAFLTLVIGPAPLNHIPHFTEQVSQFDDAYDWCSTPTSTPVPVGQENSLLACTTPVRKKPEEHRAPLCPIQMNGQGNIHNPQHFLAETNFNRSILKNPKSIVKNTRAWLPPPSQMKGRKIGPGGACGQLTRFISDESGDQHHYCPFRVRARRHNADGQIKITICHIWHSCPQVKHKWRGACQKSLWLGETLAPRVVRNVKVPVKEMLSGFRMDYKKSTTYHQMWRAVDHVRDWYLGGQRNSFHMIPALLERIREVDPGANVNWSTIGPSKTFLRAFVCPSATRQALCYCQPMVSLDACHTKNRKYPTQIFLACALDGNGRIVILCWGLAPSENKDHWIFFLEHLKHSIQGIDSPDMPLISDRHKGLLPAVAQVFPCLIHGHCANHIRANVKTNFGKAASQFFMSCVYADTKKEFEGLLDSLSEAVQNGQAAAKYIRDIDPSLWSRFAFPLPRMGQVTSNPCEQANSGLLPIRDYAPFKILVELWFYVQQKFVKRSAEAKLIVSTYTPKATRRHEQNLRHYGQWQVYYDGALQARVQTANGAHMHLVTISEADFTMTCTCRELQEMCWPCEHIMAWDDQAGRDYTFHFHRCWRTTALQRLYEPIIPCFLDNNLEFSERCCPPEIAVKKGRHRVVRIRSGKGKQATKELCSDEFYDSSGNLHVTYPVEDDPENLILMPKTTGKKRKEPSNSKRPGKVRCSLCGGLGHNKWTCKSMTRQAPEFVHPILSDAKENNVHLNSDEDCDSASAEEAFYTEGNLEGRERAAEEIYDSDSDLGDIDKDWMERYIELAMPAE